MTDLAGAMIQLYAYDAYGNAVGFDPATALTEFLYSGEQFDAKIGQQYLRQRYYDPSTGRFNRLDPFFGNHSDPQSFHKYLYTHADPIQGIDPSGLMSLGSMMSSIGIGTGVSTPAMGAMFAAIKTAGTLGLLTLGANIGVFGAALAGIAQNPIPKGFMASVGFSAAVRGVIGDLTLSIYVDFKTKKISFYLSHGVGLAPVSYFKKQAGLGINTAYGFAFRVSSPEDIEGLSVTSSFPWVSTRFPSFWKGVKGLDSMQFGYAMRTLSNYLSPNTRYKNRQGAIQAERSLTGDMSALYYSFRTYSFQATIENTIRLFDLNTMGFADAVKAAIDNIVSKMPNSLEEMNNPALANDFHDSISALENVSL